jgi:hypothetical protein
MHVEGLRGIGFSSPARFSSSLASKANACSRVIGLYVPALSWVPFVITGTAVRAGLPALYLPGQSLIPVVVGPKVGTA